MRFGKGFEIQLSTGHLTEVISIRASRVEELSAYIVLQS